MRKVFGWLLFFVGAFLLVVAVLLALTWLPDAVKRTPLNVDTYTYLTGEADKLNPATGELENRPGDVPEPHARGPRQVRRRRASAFVNTKCVNIDENDPPACLEDNDERLITNSIDMFATDRRTALAVDERRVPRRGCRPARGPGQQVAVRRREEDLPLLGRHAGHHRRRGVRRHRGHRRARDLRVRRRRSRRPRRRSSRARRASTAPTETLWVDPAHRLDHRPGGRPGPRRSRTAPRSSTSTWRTPTRPCRPTSTTPSPAGSCSAC